MDATHSAAESWISACVAAGYPEPLDRGSTRNRILDAMRRWDRSPIDPDVVVAWVIQNPADVWPSEALTDIAVLTEHYDRIESQALAAIRIRERQAGGGQSPVRPRVVIPGEIERGREYLDSLLTPEERASGTRPGLEELFSRSRRHRR